MSLAVCTNHRGAQGRREGDGEAVEMALEGRNRNRPAEVSTSDNNKVLQNATKKYVLLIFYVVFSEKYACNCLLEEEDFSTLN